MRDIIDQRKLLFVEKLTFFIHTKSGYKIFFEMGKLILLTILSNNFISRKRIKQRFMLKPKKNLSLKLSAVVFKNFLKTQTSIYA